MRLHTKAIIFIIALAFPAYAQAQVHYPVPTNNSFDDSMARWDQQLQEKNRQMEQDSQAQQQLQEQRRQTQIMQQQLDLQRQQQRQQQYGY